MKAVLCIACLLLPVFVVFAQEKSQPGSARGDSMARGKYIVERVAMCIECHTPRDESGRLLTTKYLQGAPIPVNAPPYSNMNWAVKAPSIVGLPGYTTQQGVRLLMEGITSDGRTPNPPMPPFRFNRADAEAVVGYLKSLG